MISPYRRVLAAGHRSGILWLTGLPASGKTTLARAVEDRLFAEGQSVVVLDGDVLRDGLCNDLGFSDEDRQENIRRAGEVALLFAEAGFIVICAFISPFQRDRDALRARAGTAFPEIRAFHEIYLKATVADCEDRDPKGNYAKAREGIIPEFTGVTAPYQIPKNPELVIDTVDRNIDSSVDRLHDYAIRKFSLMARNRK